MTKENDYYIKLSKLKPLLPKRYQEKISKKLPHISMSQIKRATSGRLKNEDILTQIFDTAAEMARKNALRRKKADNTLKEVLRIANKED